MKTQRIVENLIIGGKTCHIYNVINETDIFHGFTNHWFNHILEHWYQNKRKGLALTYKLR